MIKKNGKCGKVLKKISKPVYLEYPESMVPVSLSDTSSSSIWSSDLENKPSDLENKPSDLKIIGQILMISRQI